jgi:hypothetical protein
VARDRKELNVLPDLGALAANTMPKLQVSWSKLEPQAALQIPYLPGNGLLVDSKTTLGSGPGEGVNM